MNRNRLLVTVALLALLLLAGAWAILRPEGSSLLPFMGNDSPAPKVQTADNPLDADPPRLDDNGKPADSAPESNTDDGSLLSGIDEQDRQRIEAARDAERIKAERLAAEGKANPDAQNPATPGSDRPSAGDGDAVDNRTPEQKALDAERQRRVGALKAIKRPPNQSLGNKRPRTRAIKKPAGVKELADVTPKLLQDRRGLYAKYYAFSSMPLGEILDPNQPELDARTPDVTRIDPQVYFPSKDAWSDLPFDKRNFMAVWTGFLVIPEDADYWLYLGADYTGVVTLDGEAILYNDMRDYTEVSTSLTLSSGLHPIRIDYMEGENGSPVDPLAACNFMYVPEGQSKPIPVPPEMLMLPEELWSDTAPIITKLSRYEGEIGDTITIYGQNLAQMHEVDDVSEEMPGWETIVQFSGQRAQIRILDENELVVTVPVGASSGKLIVLKRIYDEKSPLPIPDTTPPIPSNSVDFTVTTQFGLFASWHNLQGWSNYDFVDETLHKPDIVRLERDFMFDTRQDLDLSFRNNPLACHWEGKLGIPAGWVAEGGMALVRFQTYGRLRVRLGEEMKQTNSPTGATFDLTTVDFEVRNHLEHYLPLSIDWTSESGPAGLTIVKMVQGGVVDALGEPGEVIWEQVETLPYQLFFPPVVPPKPPKILDAKPVYGEGEQPPVLPYDVTTTLPSIREGQTFEFHMEVFGNAEVQAAPVNLTVDGIPLEYEVTQIENGNGGSQIRTCLATLPGGLGEGAIVARLTVVTSDPFYIDVQNKGLIAYLYDLPNPGGYSKMPDLEPLTCFEVRKMPWVNYENANQFNLPFPAETFAIEWFGALSVEKEGDYRFTCRSDDGIYVWLDDNLVLVDDNLHYQREKTGDWIHLVPGVYNFRMQFFENNVHEVCVLEWDAREDKDDDTTEFIQRGIVPKRNFTWDQHAALPQKTTTHKRADGSDPE